MNLKTISIPDSNLGKTVELCEMTMDKFLAVQKQMGTVEDGMTASLEYLSHMLFVDGSAVTRKQIGEYGMSEVLKLLNRMNELFPQAEQGEG